MRRKMFKNANFLPFSPLIHVTKHGNRCEGGKRRGSGAFGSQLTPTRCMLSESLPVFWRSLCLFEYEELAAYRARAFGLHADRHSPRHHPAKQDWPGWCSVEKPAAVPPPLHRRCRPRACFTLTAGLSCVRYDNSVSSQKKQKTLKYAHIGLDATHCRAARGSAWLWEYDARYAKY